MKKCLIVVNTKKRESQASGKKIAEFLLQNGIASQFFNFDGFRVDHMALAMKIRFRALILLSL